ncbi:hypothetical protein GTQ40_13460 [Flavobacteriaceae bacterium R38]|nr:hypothetical protein [Flavobacteriaceae bacterium R38]
MCLLIACGGDKHIFTFVSYETPSDEGLLIENIDFFLETSVSMKGYVNSQKVGNYPMADIIPLLLTDIDNEYDVATNIYTITNSPKKYNKPNEQFNKELRKGMLLGGKSSKLQNVFSEIIDSLKFNSISILVSDCILDLGKENTMTQGSQVTNKIYSHLSKKQDVGVAIFKYLSDFNGTYYYDRKNTGSKNLSKRPYHKIILKNRPFYIWVLGNKHLVKEFLSKKIFEKYDQSYSYNIPMNTVPFKLLKHPKKGKVSINSERNTILFKEVDARRPVQFTIGVNLNDQPPIFEELFMNKASYKISPEYTGEAIQLEVKDKSILNEKILDKALIDKLHLTHFLQPNLLDLDHQVHEITISLNNTPAKWFKDTHLEDDYKIPADSLEHKTFAFKFITDAFDRAYKNEPALLQFKLVKNNR